MTTTPCTLTYDMLALGNKSFAFMSDDEAYHFQSANPPGPTVRFTLLEFGECCYRMKNTRFSWPAYNLAEEEKRWRDGARETKFSKGEPIIEDDGATSDLDACLHILGLDPGFSETELKAAYRQAIKMNHPDKVAALAVEFRELAERRTRLLNQALATLLCLES